jgi:VRR-NUC domain
MLPGFPDLVVLGPDGRSGFIECKRPKSGRLSDEQQALKDRLDALGHVYALATAPDAWSKIKQQWGWA